MVVVRLYRQKDRTATEESAHALFHKMRAYLGMPFEYTGLSASGLNSKIATVLWKREHGSVANWAGSGT